jgi:hypothetical protein
MTDLLAPRVVARAKGRFRELGLDERTFERAGAVLVKNLEGNRRLTRPATYEVLTRARISTEGQRGIHILFRLAHDGILCFGPHEGKQPTFVLRDEWIPNSRRLTREEALGALAHRYFTGHGPATLNDFAWWAGLTQRDASVALDLAQSRLTSLSHAGQSLWLGHERLSQGSGVPRAHLLPAFDELLVGYTDRSAFVDSAHALRVNAGGGILNPTIVVGGRIVGTWKRTLSRRAVTFSPTLFEPIAKSAQRHIERAFDRYAKFVGVPAAAHLPA